MSDFDAAPRIARIALIVAVALQPGCMSVLTNTSVFSDSSHLGTAYSGTRSNAHTFVCYGRDVARNSSSLLLAPLMLFPLVDLPLSFVVDTLLLPVDIPVTADRPPLEVGKASCRLIGM